MSSISTTLYRNICTVCILKLYTNGYYISGQICSISQRTIYYLLFIMLQLRAASSPNGTLGSTHWLLSNLLFRAWFLVYYPCYFVQVRGLLSYINLEGRVLDSCGATGDAVARVMTAHGLRVSTNDLNPRCVVATHVSTVARKIPLSQNY